MKNMSRLAKRNYLIFLLALFIYIGFGVSGYLGSKDPGLDNNWSAAITHVPSTPTNTLVPDTGWWSAIATPTPKK